MGDKNPYKRIAKDLARDKRAAGETVPQIAKNDFKPTVLINLERDYPSRGDAAGWKGIAHHIAETIGARVAYMDYWTLKSLYPEDSETHTYQELLAKHLAASGYVEPSYVIGHPCPQTLELMGNAGGYHESPEANEYLVEDMLEQDLLVSHHLNDQVLKEQGKIFDEMHPGIKKPIMAIMLVNAASIEDIQETGRKVVSMMSRYPEGTIYICGSWRTEPSDQRYMLLEMQKYIKELGKEDSLDAIEHQFSHGPDYNPYQGLIAKAKHFLIWGDSRSMLSEALYSGRTVYHHMMGGSRRVQQKLETAKQAMDFFYVNAKRPQTRKFEPINTASLIAQKIIERSEDQLRQHKDQTIKSVPGYREEWHDKLSLIWENYNFTAFMSDELLKNREFARAAVSIRGLALKHLPKFKNDEEIALIAIRQNGFAVQAVGKKLKKDGNFLEKFHLSDARSIQDYSSFADTVDQAQAPPDTTSTQFISAPFNGTGKAETSQDNRPHPAIAELLKPRP